MKIKCARAWLCLPLTLVLFAVGCATSKSPLVDTWCNPQFSPKRTDKIALTDQPHPTLQSKMLNKLLVKELPREGFQVVSSAQADYLLACVLDEAVKEQPVVHRFVDYASAEHALLGQGFAPSTVWIPIEQKQVGAFRFTSRSIRLLLYTNPKTHHGNFQLAWQGNINVNHSTSVAQEQVLLKTLLHYFGMQQNGRVNVAPTE